MGQAYSEQSKAWGTEQSAFYVEISETAHRLSPVKASTVCPILEYV